MNNRVHQRRLIRGWSQVVLTEQLEVSRRTISTKEPGRSDPGLAFAFALAIS